LFERRPFTPRLESRIRHRWPAKGGPFKTGDEIVTFNDKPVKSWEALLGGSSRGRLRIGAKNFKFGTVPAPRAGYWSPDSRPMPRRRSLRRMLTFARAAVPALSFWDWHSTELFVFRPSRRAFAPRRLAELRARADRIPGGLMGVSHASRFRSLAARWFRRRARTAGKFRADPSSAPGKTADEERSWPTVEIGP